jgi:peptidyl-prolyl cis-trans isomerase SurA
MKYLSYFVAVMVAGCAIGNAQLSSHSPVSSHPSGNKAGANQSGTSQIAAMATKPVVRVNGSVITEIDLQREMKMMFPYAEQHGGMPKGMEGEIRKGAIDMVIFEELLYQDAKKRNVQVPAAKLNKAVRTFQNQFVNKAAYEQYLKLEFNGSALNLREKIRRSLLIESMLKTEVNQKSVVTPTIARAYYNQNPKQFQHGETISIQTISIIPPADASQTVKNEAQRKIKDVVRIARAAKTARDFGLIAEQISEDDWRTKLGDRGSVETSTYPPQIVAAARKMKVGTVSDVIQMGTAYVVFRLNGRTPAGKTPFAQVQKKLQSDLQKQRVVERRAELHKQLRRDAKIEVL